MFDRPVCQKRSFKAGRKGANHILQGLHRLCEVLARLSLYTESDDGTGAADIQISIRSNEDFSNGTMMSCVKIHRLNLHVYKVEKTSLLIWYKQSSVSCFVFFYYC